MLSEPNLADQIFVENTAAADGQLIVAIHENRGGSTVTRPWDAYPQFFTINMTGGRERVSDGRHMGESAVFLARSRYLRSLPKRSDAGLTCSQEYGPTQELLPPTMTFTRESGPNVMSESPAVSFRGRRALSNESKDPKRCIR